MIVFVISGGDLNKQFTRDFIDKTKEEDSLIVACDKGLESCLKMELVPDLVIGDFDSVNEAAFYELPESTEIIKLNPIKDDTDTEAALRLVFERTTYYDCIYLLGATGRRIDHLLGNVSLLGLGLKNDRMIIMVDEYNYIQMLAPKETLELDKEGQYGQFGKYVSVFPYGGKATGVLREGFKYPLKRATLEGFNTLTVSNEITSDVAHIYADTGYLIVCETRDSFNAD